MVCFVSSGWRSDTSLWKSGHGIGSTSQLAADRTGDGRADAIAFFRDGKLVGCGIHGSSVCGYSQWKKRTRNRINRSAGSGTSRAMVVRMRWYFFLAADRGGSHCLPEAHYFSLLTVAFFAWRQIDIPVAFRCDWRRKSRRSGVAKRRVLRCAVFGNSFGTDARWLSRFGALWFRGSTRCW